MKYTATQQHWDESSLRFSEGRTVKPKNHFIPPIETDPEEILQEAMDNWEYDNCFHTCWLCGNTGHEEGVHKNNLNYWVHDTCELQMEETLKHIQHENQRIN